MTHVEKIKRDDHDLGMGWVDGEPPARVRKLEAFSQRTWIYLRNWGKRQRRGQGGARTRARHEAVYCTWNYGGYADVNEENILLRARILAENIPGCTHFLIDDGYQAKRNDRNAGICSFYPVPRDGYDREKFPGGTAAIAAALELKQRGLSVIVIVIGGREHQRNLTKLMNTNYRAGHLWRRAGGNLNCTPTRWIEKCI